MKLLKKNVFVALVSLFVLAGCTTDVPTPQEEDIKVTSVSLDKSTLSVSKNAEERLTATVSPDNATVKEVTWLSSNTANVTVSNGIVKGITAETSATITAYVDENKNGQLDSEEKSATCLVSVSKDPAEEVKVTSVTLSDKTLTLDKDATYTLTATVLPTNSTIKTVSWKSSNTANVTVTNGVVKAVKGGTTATITAWVDENGNGTQDRSEKSDTCSVTVNKEVVKVTGVTVDSTMSVRVNQEKALSATVLPSDATNKNVTWSVANSNIASVSNGKVKGLKAGTTTLTVKTEDGGFTANSTLTVEEVTQDAYTILIYLCGSNLESGYDSQTGRYSSWSECGLASGNLAEILSLGSKQPDGVNIVVETGGAKRWKPTSQGGYGISASYLERYHVEGTKLVRDAQLTKANMGLSSTLQSFVEYGINNYPADKMAMVFWNHGGAMDGVCYDENYNDDSLLNSEVSAAFKNAFKNTGRTEKFEWVAYDTCLMAVQDIAEFNSQYFNYMGASQESEPGEGWDYDGWIDDLYKNPSIDTPTLLGELADTFVQKCADTYEYYADMGYDEYRNYNDATYSILDLSKMSAYKTAFDTFSTKISSIITSKTKFSSLTSIVKKCNTFGEDQFDVVDLKQVLTQMKSNSTFSSASSEINAVLSALNNLVIHNTYGVTYKTALGGLCMVVNYTGYGYSGSYNTNETNFTTWYNINKNYGSWYSY